MLRITTIFLVLLCGSGCGPASESRSSHAQKTVLDPKSTESDVLKALILLHQPASRPQVAFWRQIIDSPQYSPLRRHRALILLLAHHLEPNMALGEFAALLNGSNLFMQEGVISVTHSVSGPLPFPHDRGTIIHIAPFVPPEDLQPAFLFMQADGDVAVDDMRGLLKHSAAGPKAAVRISHWGFVVSHPEDVLLLDGIPFLFEQQQVHEKSLLDQQLDR